ncbi:hypothetical protein BDR05DRAFT_998507 [Suillus weaverae]|nr:hypothetical protein BDR05DRAFT_998507 [Suillus weaverae]
MAFGEVVHYVTQHTAWPEPVRGITSLLSQFHCPDRPSNEHLASASSLTSSEPLVSHEAPAQGSYTAKDFHLLIQSTAAGLSALAELPHYGGERSTVPLWSQLLRALANTLSPDVLILEDAPFIMPRAQNMASQPSNLIDGHATLLAAHAIFLLPRTHSGRSRTSSRNNGDMDESMYSADSDSCDGSVDSLDLPLQALMLPGRGKRLFAVVPVLLVADSRNIVPLICSALYQRHVWGIRQPVVGLCCSSTGTTATAVFGWLNSDQSEEGCMATHLALAADIRLDPLMGVFDFTDARSAISLAQFVLGLRTHFQGVKGAVSIEAADSLTPYHWRSDLPNFETQFGGQMDERVASWTHQAAPRDPRDERERTRKRAAATVLKELFKEEQFAALSDTGLGDGVTISNWLFERHAFTVGRIPIPSDDLGNTTKINAMVKTYDQMTAFTWSDDIKTLFSSAEADSFVSDIKAELCDMNGGPNSQSSVIDAPSSEDVEFISRRISVLLHAVKGARQCNDAAKLHGANEADRNHEWDALLLSFFQPILGQRDVLLERQLNLARNLAADDSSFATRARKVADTYEDLCTKQQRSLVPSTGSQEQALFARYQAIQFSEDLASRCENGNFVEMVARHSSKDPRTGICDAILVISCPGVATAMLQHISSVNEQEKFLKSFMFIQGPKPEKFDTSAGETSYQNEKTTFGRSLSVPSCSRASQFDRNKLHNPFLYHPNGSQTTQKQETTPVSKSILCDKPSGKDLLLPVLLAEYKKRGESAISTAMNQMKTHLVSAVTFLSELGITEQPVFGLVVNDTLGAITMAWKTNSQIYVMERNVRHYDIRDPLQALQFVSILPRLAPRASRSGPPPSIREAARGYRCEPT